MKPILLNTEMVRAILEGRKTVTRRVVKPQPPNAHDILDFDEEDNSFDFLCGMIADNCFIDFAYTAKAPYRPGDILYVRETWCDPSGTGGPVLYKADMPMHWDADDTETGIAVDLKSTDYKWRPSIHMPREAARIFLRVTNVRAERLQEITEDQAIAEGFEAIKCDHPFGWPCIDCMNTGYLEPAMVGFVDTWNSTIKPADRALYGWDANPWVWVIEFERISREEAHP